MSRLTQPLLTMCSIAGVILSTYLTIVSTQTQTACILNGLFSCDAVISSAYSKIMGIPVAVLGLVWFIVATALCLTSFLKPIPRLLLSWSIVGLLAIFPLVYTEIYLVGALCLLCTLAHVLGIIIFVLSIVYWRTAQASKV